MEVIVLKHILAAIYLIAGSLHDLKSREVSDWANYGLIGSAFVINIAAALVYQNGFFVIGSIIGFAIFWALGALMYYAGQWGGGDAKLLMGLGALYGISKSSFENQFLFGFFLNMLIMGAIYGIFWSFYKAITKRKVFGEAFLQIAKKKQIVHIRKILFAFLILGIILCFFLSFSWRVSILGFLLIMGLSFYLWMAIRAIEQSCMIKTIPTLKLTPGDWIAKQITQKGKVVMRVSKIGIEQKQIDQLKKLKIKEVVVKEGIPFVPSFLLGWVAMLLLGNLLYFFL